MQAVQQTVTDEIINGLLGKHILLKDHLRFAIGGFSIQVHSNSRKVLDRLDKYFSSFASETGQATVELIAIEGEPVDLPVHFTHWQREPGKSGRKDSYVDMAYCRLIRKVRTGMVFLQSADLRVATGPCLDNINQLVNFINAQYMNWLQQHGWLICHAAALTYKDQAYAFAGFSGGGKSTLMLQLLNTAGTNYLTNDRLFLRDEAGQVNAAGIAKLPRINPGTIVHNPKLHGLMPEQQRQKFLSMPSTELRRIEDKYDVYIDQVYGPERIVSKAPLQALVILNWQHDSKQALQVERVQLTTRQALLEAVMKSPGPFYQYASGRFYQERGVLPKQDYLQLLKDLAVYEVRGGVDFDNLTAFCREKIFA